MDPKFQSSFIPKKPLSVSGGPSASAPGGYAKVPDGNIFSVVATIIFILTLLAAGGLFGYKYILNRQLASVEQQVTAARDAFQPQTILELVGVSARIMSAKNLLEKHVMLSSLFNLLQSLAVKKVQFGLFTYQNTANSPTVTIDMQAQSYNALSEQSAIFHQNSFLQNPTFSDFDLADNGNVTVKFAAQIDPKLLSYAQSVQAVSLNQ